MEPDINQDEDTPDSTHIDDPGRFEDPDTTGPASDQSAGAEDEPEGPSESIEEDADRPA
jgi:hypothetical protein